MGASAFDIIKPHLDYINNTPELIWGLMDVNLMPEQIQTDGQARCLLKIVEAHKRGELRSPITVLYDPNER